jgi:hypothetical protein
MRGFEFPEFKIRNSDFNLENWYQRINTLHNIKKFKMDIQM